VPAILLPALGAFPHALAQSPPDRKQEIGMVLDQYGAAKTPSQRTAAVEYLKHFDRKLVAATLIDHILAARNGTEATGYSALIELLAPDGCVALLDRLEITDSAVEKGKLIVASRHCQGDETLHALIGCLDDQRPVPFEAHTAQPRRVCDFAYDELFLKLRSDLKYSLDPSPHMRGIITEKTSLKTRDALISAFKARLAPAPSPSASPSAQPPPSGSPRPATASIAV
jgi:hypothetical protein